jgi:metal-dependent hydrolase (beta-lactamase superfamily II)
MEIDPEKDKFVCEDLCDNRDLTILRANHFKTDKLIEEKKKQTFKDEVLWLKIRNVLIRAIACAHYGICNMRKCEDELNDLVVLVGLIDTLKEYMALMECCSCSVVSSVVS